MMPYRPLQQPHTSNEATEIDVPTKTSGRIREVLVNEGDFVAAGQVLARMDTEQLEAQRRQAEAQLKRSTVSVDTAIADGVVVHRTFSTPVSPMKLHARYVTVRDFDDQYFEVSFGNEHPAADYDPDAPMRPYALLQRQFEDEDGGGCYLETHDPDRYAGHLRLRLVEFTPTRLAFEVDRPQDRLVEVTFRLGARRFREVQRVINIIFDLNV